MASLTVYPARPAWGFPGVKEPDRVRTGTRPISSSWEAQDEAPQRRLVQANQGGTLLTGRLPIEIQLDILDFVVDDLDAWSILWEVSSSAEAPLAVRPLCWGNEEHYARTRARRLSNICLLLPQVRQWVGRRFVKVPAMGEPTRCKSYWVDFRHDVFAPLAGLGRNETKLYRGLARRSCGQVPAGGQSFLAQTQQRLGMEMIRNVLVPEDHLGDEAKVLEMAQRLPGLGRIYVLQAFAARYPQGFPSGNFIGHVVEWERELGASAGADGRVDAWPFSVMLEAYAAAGPGQARAPALWTTERPDAFWPYAPDWYYKRNGVTGRMSRMRDAWARTEAPGVEMVLVSPRRNRLEPTFLDGNVLAPPRRPHG